MSMDPILRLQNKIKNAKRQRDDLDKSMKKDAEEIARLKQQVAEKNAAADSQEQRVAENKMKLERVDLLVGEVEKSIRKIIETSLALEKTLEEEVGVA